MPSAPEDNMHKDEDAAAQIARLREQVEALMNERVAPAVADKVREQPLLAILLAAAVGYVLGRTARWSMRTLRLVRIAAEAEGVRLREQARRGMTRGMLGMVAMAFLLAAVVFSQIAGWCWLRLYWAEPGAALAMVGADLVAAALLLLIAARSSPGRIELEALAVRRRALESATGSIELATLVMQVLNRLIELLARKRS